MPACTPGTEAPHANASAMGRILVQWLPRTTCDIIPVKVPPVYPSFLCPALNPPSLKQLPPDSGTVLSCELSSPSSLPPATSQLNAKVRGELYVLGLDCINPFTCPAKHVQLTNVTTLLHILPLT